MTQLLGVLGLEQQTIDKCSAVDREIFLREVASDLQKRRPLRDESQPSRLSDVLAVDYHLAEACRIVLCRSNRDSGRVAEVRESLFRGAPLVSRQQASIVLSWVESGGDDAANPCPPTGIRSGTEMSNHLLDTHIGTQRLRLQLVCGEAVKETHEASAFGMDERQIF